MNFIAENEFTVTQNYYASNTNIHGCLYFASQRDFTIHEGDLIEILPGGFFVTRNGKTGRAQITSSRENLQAIKANANGG